MLKRIRSEFSEDREERIKTYLDSTSSLACPSNNLTPTNHHMSVEVPYYQLVDDRVYTTCNHTAVKDTESSQRLGSLVYLRMVIASIWWHSLTTDSSVPVKTRAYYSPTTVQDDRKGCHFELLPNPRPLLRDTDMPSNINRNHWSPRINKFDERSDRRHYIPPGSPDTDPVVHTGHTIGNLRPSSLVSICPLTHSLQKRCLQGSKQIESSGGMSKQMRHANSRIISSSSACRCRATNLAHCQV